jgi:cyclophilin family peptidyl-prolyl cis-trans isomerase
MQVPPSFFQFLTIALLLSEVMVEAKAPTAPSQGTVAFSRAGYPASGPSNTPVLDTWHSYSLNWQDNALDEEGYLISQRFGSSGAWRPWQALSANTTQTVLSVEGRPAGSVVQFRVEAWKFNGAATETSSLQINTRVPNTQSMVALTTPTSVSATMLDLDPSPSTAQFDDGQVKLTWVDNSAADLLQQVQIRQIRVGMTDTDWLDLGTVPFGVETLTLSNRLAGTSGRRVEFIPGQAYQFRVRSILGSSATIWATTPDSLGSGALQIPVLTPPSGLDVQAGSEDSFLLTWEDKSNNESGYAIEYRAVGTETPGAFEFLGTVGENARQVTVPALPNATLEFRVYAFMAFVPAGGGTTSYHVSTYSPTAQGSTGIFRAPADLTATTSGIAGAVELSWRDLSSADDGYDVLVRPSGSVAAFAFAKAVPHGVTKVSVDSFTAGNDASGMPIFTPLTKGAAYEFVVRAAASGETSYSSPSNLAVATPKDGFTSRLDAAFQAGVSFSRLVTTSNEAQRTQLTVAGLPDGLSFDSPSATISGIPTVFGHFPCEMTAVFQDGTTARSTLHLRGIAAKGIPTVKQTLVNRTLGVGVTLNLALDDFFTDPDSESVVRLETTKGDIDLMLYPSAAPAAVANFLAYVNAGDYDGIAFHRLINDFVLQAGSLRPVSAPNFFTSVAQRPSPVNEPGLSNLPWTLAAAKRGARTSWTTVSGNQVLRDDRFGYVGAPDSATTDFFINLGDNAANLDNQNSGFTVFGRVADASQPVVNAIKALPVGNYVGNAGVLVDGRLRDYNGVPMDATSAPASMNANLTVRVVEAGLVPALRYSITGNTGVEFVTADITEGRLLLTGVAAGSREITITALDADGGSSSQTFTITAVADYAPPVVTKQPVSVLARVGGSAAFSVTASGSDLGFQWRHNGTPLPGKTTPSLTLSSLQMAQGGAYDVIVSNGTRSITSAAATLTLRAPADITSALPSQLLVIAGQPLDLSVEATGGPVPTFTWRRGSTVVKGQTTRRLYLPSTTLADAGLYRGTASNGSTDTTNACQVFIVDKSTRTVIAAPDKPVKLTAPVAGPFTHYQWRKNGVAIPLNTPGFSGINAATLTIAAAAFGADSADYTCVVTPPAGLPVTISGIVRLAVSLAPTLSPMTGEAAPPVGSVGNFYLYTLPYPKDEEGQALAHNTPASFSISGLPPGLTLNASTGLISGFPTSSGSFQITARASNPSGRSTPVTGIIVIEPMYSAGAGTFVALVDPSPAINRDKGGRLDLSITDNASYSAKLLLGNDNYAFKGSVSLTNSQGGLVYAAVLNFKSKAGRTLNLLFNVVLSSGDLIGIITDGTTQVSFSGHRQFWSEIRNGCIFTGRINLGLHLSEADVGRQDIPQRDGYTTLNISRSGIGTFAGKLADGSTITGSSIVSSQGRTNLFQMLYRNTGSLLARIAPRLSRDGNTGTVRNFFHSMQGQARWIKDRPSTSTDRLYRLGIPPTVLDVVGGYYRAPDPLVTPIVLNLPSVADNAYLDFSQGGLSMAAQNPDILFRLGNDNVATLPSVNPTQVTLRVTADTGFYTGTFTLLDGVSIRRSVTFQGLIIPEAGEIPGLPATSTLPAQTGLPPRTAYGAGYFLLDQLPVAPSRVSASRLSGKARLSAKPFIITTSPASQNVLAGSDVTFFVSVSGGISLPSSTFIYQWRLNGVKLSDGPGISGATTATLSLTGVNAADAGSYECTLIQQVVTGVGTYTPNIITTAPATLTLITP